MEAEAVWDIRPGVGPLQKDISIEKTIFFALGQ